MRVWLGAHSFAECWSPELAGRSPSGALKKIGTEVFFG